MTRATVESCPVTTNIVTTQWTSCLVDKRIVGVEPFTGNACEIRIKAGGIFEYVKNGVVTASTLPVAQLTSAFGQYTNQLLSGDTRFFLASMSGRAPNTSTDYAVNIRIGYSVSFPNDVTLNIDSASYLLPNGTTENCTPNI